MASRHINLLRKYQKPILVVMGVILMVTFTVGYSLQQLIDNSSGARNEDPVVVTWVGGKVRRSELGLKQTTHQIAVNFLRLLLATVVERGGSPVVNGQSIPKDTPPAQIMQMDPGITGDSSEFSIVRTMLLARKADELGIVVDQQAAREFVQSLSIPDVTEQEWPTLLSRVTPDGLSISLDQLLGQIAFDLKANHMQVLSQAGLMGVSPGQFWEYHNRLNRRFVIEAYPVDVARFAAQVQEEPTEAELRKLFEKGKLFDPDPAMSEPGFHQPHRVAFEWLRVDFAPFLAAATKQITDEQVAKQYELDITQGKHKVIELPPDPTKPADPVKPADPAVPTDPAKPADPAKPEDSKPGEEKPVEKPAEKPADDKPAEKPAEGESDKKPCDQDQPAAEAAKPEDNQPDTVPAPKTEDKPADTKPAEATPGEAKPAEAKPGETPATGPAPAVAPPPKFKPLEEVKEDIRKELAQPIAQDAMQAAIEKATTQINNFGRKYRRWKSAQEAIKAGMKLAKAEDPGTLDVEAIAAAHGFKSGSTKLVDRHEVGNFEIGQKVMEFDMEAIRRGQFRQLSFADLAYGSGDVLYNPSPQPVNSTEPDVSYVYWRTAEEEAKDPTFDEARKQLVEAWKLAKALDVAKADAQKLADKAKSAKTLKEVVPDPAKVITTVPFSWLTTGSLAFSSGAPSLSTVPGIDLAGTEFMEAVFSLKPGEAGVAPNQSHRTLYIVRVVSQEPTDDVLKEQFLESGLNMQVRMVARNESMRTRFELFEGLDKEMNLVWERPPVESRE